MNNVLTSIEESPEYVFLISLLFIASAIDIKTKKIPNQLSLIIFIAGISWQITNNGLGGFFHGIAASSIAFGIFLALHMIGAMGAGDVKLIGATAVFMNENEAVLAALLSLAIGSLIGLAILIVKGGLPDYIKRYFMILKTYILTKQWVYLAPASDEVAGQKFAFAIAISAGCSLVLLKEPLELLTGLKILVDL